MFNKTFFEKKFLKQLKKLLFSSKFHPDLASTVSCIIAPSFRQRNRNLDFGNFLI